MTSLYVLTGPGWNAQCASAVRVDDPCPASVFHEGTAAGVDKISSSPVKLGFPFAFGVLSLPSSLLPSSFLLQSHSLSLLCSSLPSLFLSSLSALIVGPIFPSPQWPTLLARNTGGWHQEVLPCQHTRTLGLAHLGTQGMGDTELERKL